MGWMDGCGDGMHEVGLGDDVGRWALGGVLGTGCSLLVSCTLVKMSDNVFCMPTPWVGVAGIGPQGCAGAAMCTQSVLWRLWLRSHVLCLWGVRQDNAGVSMSCALQDPEWLGLL